MQARASRCLYRRLLDGEPTDMCGYVGGTALYRVTLVQATTTMRTHPGVAPCTDYCPASPDVFVGPAQGRISNLTWHPAPGRFGCWLVQVTRRAFVHVLHCGANQPSSAGHLMALNDTVEDI